MVLPESAPTLYAQLLDQKTESRPGSEEQQEPVFARLPSENELSKTSCDHAPVTFFLNSIRIEISAGCPAELLASLVSILKSYA